MTGLNNWKKIRELGFKDQLDSPRSATEEEEKAYKKVKEGFTKRIKELQKQLLRLEIKRYNESNIHRN